MWSTYKYLHVTVTCLWICNIQYRVRSSVCCVCDSCFVSGEMLLPLYHHQQQPLIPPKTFPVRIFPPFLIPRTLIPQRNVRRANYVVVRSSASDRKTLPQSAIQRIAEKLRSLGFVEEKHDSQTTGEESGKNSPGEIFVPLPDQLPIHRVGHTIDTSWSTPSYPVPKPGSGAAISRYHELKRVWKKEKEIERKKEEKVPSLAELTLPPAELRRLRSVGIRLTKKLKIGKAGITEGIVNGIHERWRTTEVVKIFCEDICRMNMKRTHDVLEVCRRLLPLYIRFERFHGALMCALTPSSIEIYEYVNEWHIHT